MIDNETMKQRMQEATEWMKSLSPQELKKEAVKAKKLCQEHKLITKLELLDIKRKYPNEVNVRLAQTALMRAYLYRKHEEEKGNSE